MKVSKGSTVVEFCYYKLPEFKLLSEAHQDKLKAHRNAKGDYKGSWSGNMVVTRIPETMVAARGGT